MQKLTCPGKEEILVLLVRMSKILVVEALVQLQEWKPFVFSPKTPLNVSCCNWSFIYFLSF